MQAVAAPADTAPTTFGARPVAGANASQKPACHQQRCPPPANTTCSNIRANPLRVSPLGRHSNEPVARPCDDSPMSLRLITLGGTFDKVYDPRTGELGFGRTCLPEMLEAARIDPLPPISALMLVDSLDMRDEHREMVVATCRHCDEEALVLIHGTDTMTDTAAALAAAALGKCVVLTGA